MLFFSYKPRAACLMDTRKKAQEQQRRHVAYTAFKLFINSQENKYQEHFLLPSSKL